MPERREENRADRTADGEEVPGSFYEAIRVVRYLRPVDPSYRNESFAG